MGNYIIKTAIRSLFVLTSRKRSIMQALRIFDDYMTLADGLSGANGSLSVRVPPMRGVDEDMRDWSFFMILEHNAIVARSISETVRQLARGEPLSGAATIDPKTGVMPSAAAGEEQLTRFQHSIDDHLKMVNTLGRLRGTATTQHPIFGDFDAHMWNCMFSFHLKVHYDQAEYVIRMPKEK